MRLRIRLVPASVRASFFSRWVLVFIVHLAAGWLWARFSSVTFDHGARWALMYGGIALLATGTFNRLWTGWLVTQLTIGAIGLGVVFKEQLLQQPLLAHDVIYFVRNAWENVELLGAYPRPVIGSLVLGGIALFAVVWCARREKPAISVRHAGQFWVHALVTTVCATITLKSWSQVFGQHARHQGQGILRTELGTFRYEMWYMIVSRHNALPNFLASFWEFEVHEPNDRVQAIRFRTLSARVPPPAGKREAAKPDMLVVLRESQADFWRFGEKSPPPADPPWIQSRWEGQVRVHVFGGATWLTEFSFLTGFCWGDFGAAGAYAPFTLAPRMREALPVQLQRLGYRTVVFYPVQGSFLNARRAYRQYGFETFFSSEELPIAHVWQDLSDRELYTAALQRLRETDDGRPVFAFILTMRNHGPHDRPAQKIHSDLPPEWPAALRSSAADYLERQAETNTDYAWLQKVWLDSSRPRVLLSFGDHWPSLEGGVPWLINHPTASQPTQRQVFLTPLVFQANYPGAFAPRLREYDIVFVGATLLEYAGLETGDFFRSNMWLRDQCAGEYVDAPDQPLIRGYLTWAHVALGAWQ